MTLRELSYLYCLSRETEMDRRRLQELEARALPDARIIAGAPHGSGMAELVGRHAAEVAGLRGIIETKYKRCLYERDRLEHYIAGIDDSLLRQIFTYRFVEGLTWYQTAMRLGGGNTAEGVKKRVIRYLHKK